MEKDEKKKTYVSFQLDEESAALLDNAANLSGRSRRKEAFLRLKDHLLKFDVIAAFKVNVNNN